MKVTVTGNFLNVRIGAPSLNAPANVYLSPGDTIEVHDHLYKGDSYEGIDDWHGDDAGNFYWSGRTTLGDPATAVYYNRFLKQFDQQILSTQGAGTTIMVIDEGIVQNGSFFDLSHMSALPLNTDPINNQHGNFIGGIIAGKAGVIGLAPKARVISLKYKSDRLTSAQFLDNLASALRSALNNPGPTVVNLSQAFTDDILKGCQAQQSQIATLIKQLHAAPNKFVLCAMGDNMSINDQLFPSGMPECISIGSIDEYSTDLEITVPLQVLSAMTTYKSFGVDFQTVESRGSSFVTAVITALCSCIISSRLPAVISRADLLALLKKYQSDRQTFKYGALDNFQYQIT
ncbi:hypothetical protein FHW88_004993 [Mucilaginibacter sp. SG538B]|uniref:S8/S53 family peptidase n=1 Tax=Mucilaginibacter sp. SG538B TaxID=2587021 RepID=UPI00159D41B9|nr:S8/S53 family peptidase [Mucilaginibacter sp. SG538B]NVM66675.1 hypothetical protein [Mucilaginibacter sp. SG538B]